jgi:hypothetical protein
MQIWLKENKHGGLGWVGKSTTKVRKDNKWYYSKTCGGNSKTCEDDDITNFGGNSEPCQDDNIAVLYMNIVFISYRKTLLIYSIVQMIIMDLVALGCITWHSAVYQGTRQSKTCEGNSETC